MVDYARQGKGADDIMKVTKVREFIATIFVIVLIIALAAGIALALGKRVPILSNITDMLGLG